MGYRVRPASNLLVAVRIHAPNRHRRAGAAAALDRDLARQLVGTLIRPQENLSACTGLANEIRKIRKSACIGQG